MVIGKIFQKIVRSRSQNEIWRSKRLTGLPQILSLFFSIIMAWFYDHFQIVEFLTKSHESLSSFEWHVSSFMFTAPAKYANSRILEMLELIDLAVAKRLGIGSIKIQEWIWLKNMKRANEGIPDSTNNLAIRSIDRYIFGRLMLRILHCQYSVSDTSMHRNEPLVLNQ